MLADPFAPVRRVGLMLLLEVGSFDCEGLVSHGVNLVLFHALSVGL